MSRRSLLLLAALLLISCLRVASLAAVGDEPIVRVGLVYDPDTDNTRASIREAYDSVLEEEGVPHAWISTNDLLLIDGDGLADRYAALIFPDGLARQMPEQVLHRATEYVRSGGDAMVVLDPGIKEPNGAYRSGGVLAPLAGVQYQRYRERRAGAYVEGHVGYRDPETTARWEIPPGKLYEGHVVGGYSYGRLRYPMASAQVLERDVTVFASYGSVPVLSQREVGDGNVLWVNLPLGYLKSFGDDLPLRTMLRTFLFDVTEVPHLVPAPGGVGGLVMDWHIDSNIEWEGIPRLIRSGILRPDLNQQFDVTAGPFRDQPGDGLGFDACGAGANYLRQLMPYGDVGSHGGWSHNYFSKLLEAGELEYEEVEALIKRNVACLESVTDEDVRAYSAPNGVHPQPTVTRVLEKLGIKAYYYTGDSGSAPNRTFAGGHKVSDEVWAFPVMPNGLYASIGEMIKEDVAAVEVEAWLDDTVDYVVDQRAIRLLYSHPYDLENGSYRAAFSRFLDGVEERVSNGELRVEPMAYFADFMSRLVDTDFSFTRVDGGIDVRVERDGTLEDVSFAVPDWAGEPVSLPDTVERVGTDGTFTIYAVTGDVNSVSVRFR